MTLFEELVRIDMDHQSEKIIVNVNHKAIIELANWNKNELHRMADELEKLRNEMFVRLGPVTVNQEHLKAGS